MAQPTTPDNLAQPLSQGVTAELYRAAIGPRAQAAYLRYFMYFDAQGRTSATWHWPAYWCTLNWMLYRRLWGPAGIYLASMAAAALLVFGVGKLVVGYDITTGLLLFMMFLGAAFVVPALYAHAWYYNHCQRRISAALREHEDIAQACAALAEQARPTRRLLVLISANAVLALLVAALLGWVLTPSAEAPPAASGEPGPQTSANLPEASAAAQTAASAADAPASAASAVPLASPATSAAAGALPSSVPAASGASAVPLPTSPASPVSSAASSVPAAQVPLGAASSWVARASLPSMAASAPAGLPSARVDPPQPHLTPAQIEARVSQAAGAAPGPEPKPESTPVLPALAAASRPSRAASAPAVPAAPGVRPATAPARVAPPQWFVQVGVFAEEANAQGARAKIASAGLQPSVTEQGGAARRLLRVRVGPFATRAEAENASLQVQALDLPAVVMLAPP